jgi:peptidoglycan/LPS O-acetylase OafA/YrhL
MVYSEITGFYIIKNRNINYGVPALIMVTAVLLLEDNIKVNSMVKFFVWLGEASYAMYLFHYHIITFFSRLVFPKLFGINNTNIIVDLIKIIIGIGCTIILSLIIYELIDKQIQKKFRMLFKKYRSGP